MHFRDYCEKADPNCLDSNCGCYANEPYFSLHEMAKEQGGCITNEQLKKNKKQLLKNLFKPEKSTVAIAVYFVLLIVSLFVTAHSI
jgi:hypothetical protein